MKHTHLKQHAIALAVGLALSSLATAQTTSDVDTNDPDQVQLATTSVDNIENDQVLIDNANVSASTGESVSIGSTLINGVDGSAVVEALDNALSVAAAANGGADDDGVTASSNLIDITVGTTSPDAEIASGQLFQGEVSALVDDSVVIGAELNGALGELDLDVNSTDISAVAAANAVENRIEGDQSAAVGGVNGSAQGGLANTEIADDATASAEVGADSDLSISSTQLADGSVEAGLSDDSTMLIGVGLSSGGVATELSGELNASVIDTEIDVDASGNSVFNEIDVDAGGPISRNIATAQSVVGESVSAFVNNVNVGVDLGATPGDSLDLDSATGASVSVNSTDISADALGNSASFQIVVDLNAAGSNQSIANQQAIETTEGVSSVIDDVNIGIEVGADAGEIFDGVVDVETLTNTVASTSTGNSSNNLLASQSIASDSTSVITDVQSLGASNVTAEVTDVAVGIETLASIAETELNVVSTTIDATATGNSANNRVQLDEIADGSDNEIELTQTGESTVSATIDDVTIGADIIGQFGNAGDAIDGAVTDNAVSVIDTELQSSAVSNTATNAVVLGSIADDSSSQVSSSQTANETTAEVSGVRVGVELSGAGDQDSAIDLTVNATDIDASATANSGDNDILLLGSGANSVNLITSEQTTTDDTTAEVDDVIIGLRLQGGAGDDFSASGDVNVSIADADVSAQATANNADNRIAIAENGTAAENAISNNQVLGGDVDAQTSNVFIGAQSLGNRQISLTGTNGVELSVSGTSVDSSAIGNTGRNQVLLTGLGVDSENTIDNTQIVADSDVSAETSVVSIGLAVAPLDVLSPETGLDVDGDLTLSTDANVVASTAQVNSAANSVNALSSFSGSTTIINNTQSAGGDDVIEVDALTAGVVVGGAIATDDTIVGGNTSIVGASNQISSAADVNTAVNSITAESGSAAGSSNSIASSQSSSADVSASTAGVAIGLGAFSSDQTTLQGSLDVAVTGNDISASAAGNTAANSIDLSGGADDSVNAINNEQSFDDGSVTAAVAVAGAGIIGGAGFVLAENGFSTDGDVNVTAVNNQVSSEARVNNASNTIVSGTSFVGSDNEISSDQSVGLDGAPVTVTSASAGVLFGAALTAADSAVTGSLTVGVDGNEISSETRVNAAGNSIVSNDGSAQGSSNVVSNTQGGDVEAGSFTGAVGLGAVNFSQDAASITGDANVAANNNDVSSLATVNSAGNSIVINGIADDTSNEVNNTQTVNGEVTAVTGFEGLSDLVNIGLFSLEDAAIDGAISVSASSNDVSSEATGNVAVNTIRNDVTARESVNSITSSQDNVATGAGTNALTNATNIGVNIDLVDGDNDGVGGLEVSANSNDVSATSTFNAVNNIIEIASLGDGSDNDISNTQNVDLSAANAVVDTRVSGIAIGAVVSDTAPTADIDVSVNDNDVSASATGNSVLNAISVDNFGGNNGNDILNLQTVSGNGNILSSTISSADIGLTFADNVDSILNLNASVSGNNVSSSAIGNTAINNISVSQLGGAGSSINNTQSITGVSIQSSIGSELGGINIGINSRDNTLGGVSGNVTVSVNNNRISATAVGNSATNRIGGIGSDGE